MDEYDEEYQEGYAAEVEENKQSDEDAHFLQNPFAGQEYTGQFSDDEKTEKRSRSDERWDRIEAREERKWAREERRDARDKKRRERQLARDLKSVTTGVGRTMDVVWYLSERQRDGRTRWRHWVEHRNSFVACMRFNRTVLVEMFKATGKWGTGLSLIRPVARVELIMLDVVGEWLSITESPLMRVFGPIERFRQVITRLRPELVKIEEKYLDVEEDNERLREMYRRMGGL